MAAAGGGIKERKKLHMNKYHKIQSIYKRHTEGKSRGAFIDGEWSLPEFEYLKDNKWTFTEKVDGTNIRIMFDGTSIKYGGKTDNASIPVFLLTRLDELFKNKELLFKEVFGINEGISNFNVCLYGEGYGARIQKGGGNYKADGVDFVLFDVKIDNWWLKKEAVQDIADKLNIKIVPIIGEGTIKEAENKCREGFNSVWGNFQAEGIVLRPAVELSARNGHRIITKIKCKDFVKE